MTRPEKFSRKIDICGPIFLFRSAPFMATSFLPSLLLAELLICKLHCEDTVLTFEGKLKGHCRDIQLAISRKPEGHCMDTAGALRGHSEGHCRNALTETVDSVGETWDTVGIL